MSSRRIRALSLSLLLVAIATAPSARADWGNTDKMNKWFNDQSKKKFNIQGTGDVQKAGSVQPAPKELQKTGPIQIPRGIKAIIQSEAHCEHRYSIGADALFDFDKSNLNARAEETLSVLGPMVLKESIHPVTIEGNTDGIGTDDYNQKLSDKRAATVEGWLLSHKFLTAAATTRGLGKSHPIAPNTHPDGSDDPAGRQKNRRVEVVVDTCTTNANAAGGDNKSLVWVEDMDLGFLTQGYGEGHKEKSVDQHPLTIAGKKYTHGLGTHAQSELPIDLKGVGQRFEAVCGVDDEVGSKGSVNFEVWVDNGKVFDSGILHGGEEPIKCSVDLNGFRSMVLIVNDGGDGIDFDHADWADARINLVEGATTRPEAISVQSGPPIITASHLSKIQPSINGSRVVGASPGKPFLFLIPATGAAPLRYEAAKLPDGLKLDGDSGIISGVINEEGVTDVVIAVQNANGAAETAKANLKIVCGKDQLGLTPPMGWNSWNVWAASVDQEKVKAAADWLVKSGLAAHGYQYINIDDGWEGTRDAHGHIQSNSKFPDMQKLADYVHSKGLKLGIYSSPGPKTCQGLEGSYKHEDDDAKTFASWGIDYLKYDLCSYGKMLTKSDEEEVKAPYDLMGKALAGVKRDIFYSLCEYGMADVWKWGASVRGNSWRTTGDIGDAWGTVSRLGFSESDHAQYAGPGHWNDPDMLVVGKVGMGWGAKVHATRLTPNEQITHITLWSLISAPLLIGCDLANLDDFTLNLLCNDEVIAVNQDALGKPATRVAKDGLLEVWSRPLNDGTVAVGMFNRSISPREAKVSWKDIGVKGSLPVRDLWEQTDRGSFDESYSASIPAHGARLVKIGAPAAQ